MTSSTSTTTIVQQRATVLAAFRLFYTRAHPRPKPMLPIPHALDRLLKDGEKRKKTNKKQDERLQKIAELKGNKKRTQRGYPDETIELALNLNLDPRKPGQSLRGNLVLPHGTGKKGQSVLVFTTNTELAERVKAAGASHVGGTELVDEVINGTVSAGDAFQVALATMEMIPILQKKGAARILGPRGLMPNPKSGTAVESPEAILEQLEGRMMAKQVEFRTEKEGVVHLPIGKQSFGTQKLLENIGAVMATIYEVKPESYGKGKKKAKKTTKQQPKYLLSAYLSSTQGKGLKLDLRTVDPTSPFFLSEVDPLLVVKSTTTPTDDVEAAPAAVVAVPTAVVGETTVSASP